MSSSVKLCIAYVKYNFQVSTILHTVMQCEFIEAFENVLELQVIRRDGLIPSVIEIYS